jgi:hypothetical protein
MLKESNNGSILFVSNKCRHICSGLKDNQVPSNPHEPPLLVPCSLTEDKGIQWNLYCHNKSELWYCKI